MTMFNLMAFPGGGAYGAFQAGVLDGMPPSVLAGVHGVAGTSIGSVMAGAVATHKTEGLLKFFMFWIDRIFAGYRWRHFLSYPMPRYGDKALNDALKALFGDVLLMDLEIPVWIVAAHASGKPKVFFSRDGSDGYVPLWEAVRASCAAPTFLQRWNGKSDGGLVANNPGMVGVAGAMAELEMNHSNIRVLKIGTGHEPVIDEEWRDKENARGARTYLGNILFAHRAHLDGAVDSMHDYFVRCVVDPRRFLSIDFVPDFSGHLDDPRVAERIVKKHGREISEGTLRAWNWLESAGN